MEEQKIRQQALPGNSEEKTFSGNGLEGTDRNLHQNAGTEMETGCTEPRQTESGSRKPDKFCQGSDRRTAKTSPGRTGKNQ